MKIFIAAASGNIGSRVATHILASGRETVLMTRRPEKVQPGATVASFDTTDASALIKATEGVHTLFWLSPPAFSAPSIKEFYLRSADAATQAIERNHIRRVVNLSGLQSGNAPADSILGYIQQTEKMLSQAAANIVHLRAGWFMQNLLWQPAGLLCTQFPEDLAIPLISTDDIGDIAAQYLLSPHWTGHRIHNLMGPEDLTTPQIAATLNRQNIRISSSQQRDSFAQMGATPDAIEAYAELYDHLADPAGPYSEPRTPEAFTATSLVEFGRQKGLLC